MDTVFFRVLLCFRATRFRDASINDRGMRSRRVAWKMWEKGDGFRKAAATINRGASCVRAMLLNIVLAARNVKPPRSGKARGSFREIQALAGHSLQIFVPIRDILQSIQRDRM